MGVEALQFQVGFWDAYMPVARGGVDAMPGFKKFSYMS